MIELHPIQATDLASIAALHAASWRATYQSVLRPEFLADGLLANREALWCQRLAELSPQAFGFIARHKGRPVGFIFVYRARDARWGTLIDNLHVQPGMKGQGIGRRLLKAVAQACLSDGAGLYLKVYDDNHAAKGFYQALGASVGACSTVAVPGGGHAREWQYSWPSAAALQAALIAPAQS